MALWHQTHLTAPLATSPKSFRTSAHAGLFLTCFALPSHSGLLLMPCGSTVLPRTHVRTCHRHLSKYHTICSVWMRQVASLLQYNFYNLSHMPLFRLPAQSALTHMAAMGVRASISVEDGAFWCAGVDGCVCIWTSYCNWRVQTQGANVISAHLLNLSNWEHDQQHSNRKPACQTNCF